MSSKRLSNSGASCERTKACQGRKSNGATPSSKRACTSRSSTSTTAPRAQSGRSSPPLSKILRPSSDCFRAPINLGPKDLLKCRISHMTPLSSNTSLSLRCSASSPSSLCNRSSGIGASSAGHVQGTAAPARGHANILITASKSKGSFRRRHLSSDQEALTKGSLSRGAKACKASAGPALPVASALASTQPLNPKRCAKCMTCNSSARANCGRTPVWACFSTASTTEASSRTDTRAGCSRQGAPVKSSANVVLWAASTARCAGIALLDLESAPAWTTTSAASQSCQVCGLAVFAWACRILCCARSCHSECSATKQ
mmetsp:Transcript_80608/g.261237  ORF Transcript_80608/g.261237 Transcript_80608/m.261237 type:complete len:315 (-) Transcript_80608:1083-2027(-)